MAVLENTQKLGTKYVLCGELVKDYQDKSPTEKREFIKQFLTNEDKAKFDAVVAALTATDKGPEGKKPEDTKSEQPSDKNVDSNIEAKKDEPTSDQPSGNTEHKVDGAVPSGANTEHALPGQPTVGDSTSSAQGNKVEGTSAQPYTDKKVNSEGTPISSEKPVSTDGNGDQPVSTQPSVNPEPKKDESAPGSVSSQPVQPSSNEDQPASTQPAPKDPVVTVEPVTVEQGTNKTVSYTVAGVLPSDVLTFETTGNTNGMTVMSETVKKIITVSATDDAVVTLADNPLVYKIMNDGKQVGTLTVTVVVKTVVSNTEGSHTEGSHTEGSHTEGSHTEFSVAHNEGPKPHVVSLNYVEDEFKNSFQIKQGETKVFHYVPVFSDGKEHDASDTNVDQTFAAPEDYVTHFKELGITITPDFVNRTITISASDTASVENGHSYYFGEANGNLIFGVVSKES